MSPNYGYSADQILVSEIFIAINHGKYCVPGFNLQRRSWFWYLNGVEITATAARQAVYDFVYTPHFPKP